MKKKDKFLCAIVIIIAVFFVLAFGLVKFSTLPVSFNDEKEERIEVPAGTTVREISIILKEKKLIRSPLAFYAAVRYPIFRKVITGNGSVFSLKSGVYKIAPSMSLSRILDVLSSGQQDFIRVAIPEGLTISKIAMRLDEAGVCSCEDFKNAAKDAELLEHYKIPAQNFEGYLFPDTYFFTPAMTGKNVVCLMVDNFFNKIKEIPNLSSMDSEKLNETVILASIVEREYRLADEAPLIASVFKNRISHNIGLYSCATIEYILTEIEGREHPDVITYKDLSINSPYNTYKWAGLTPGAISNPGVVALNAATNPAKTNYYYFRLVDAEQGKHVFSKDFSTHINEGYISKTKR